MSHYVCKICLKRYDDCKCDSMGRADGIAWEKENPPITATEIAYQNAKHVGVEPDSESMSRSTLVRGKPPRIEAECSSDAVHAPSHYMLFDNLESIEVIARTMTVSEFRGFCLGNVLKYRLRAGKKAELANMEQDLKKAEFYKELFEKHKGLCHG